MLILILILVSDLLKNRHSINQVEIVIFHYSKIFINQNHPNKRYSYTSASLEIKDTFLTYIPNTKLTMHYGGTNGHVQNI